MLSSVTSLLPLQRLNLLLELSDLLASIRALLLLVRLLSLAGFDFGIEEFLALGRVPQLLCRVLAHEEQVLLLL